MTNQNKKPTFFEQLTDYITTKEPLEQEVGDYLRKHSYEPQKYSNALRHQYASAVFTQKYSPNEAKWLGYVNEGIPLSGLGDMKIDLENNKIGREYALKYPNYTKQQYLDLMFKNMTLPKHRKNF